MCQSAHPRPILLRRRTTPRARCKATAHQTGSEAGCRQNVRIQSAHIIHLRAPVNPHLRQNALNELQIRFLPLGDNFTRRVSTFQSEFKISALQPVFAQHLLHHLRDGLVLKYGTLPGVLQQCQTGAECKPVVGLVFRCGQPFQTGHNAMDILPLRIRNDAYFISTSSGGMFAFREVNPMSHRNGSLSASLPRKRKTSGFTALPLISRK